MSLPFLNRNNENTPFLVEEDGKSWNTKTMEEAQLFCFCFRTTFGSAQDLDLALCLGITPAEAWGNIWGP